MTLPSADSTNWNTLLKAHVLAGHNADGTHKLPEITEYAIATFTRDLTAASGDVEYDVTDFTPRQIMFFAGVAGNAAAAWGYDDGTDAMCTFQSFNNNMGSNTSASMFLNPVSGSTWQTAVVKTLDSDGFTLTWTKTGSPSGTATIIAICFK